MPIVEPCQTMRNSRYLQRRIVSNSTETLQIKLLSSRLMFDKLTKLKKKIVFTKKQKFCLDKKDQCKRSPFISITIQVVLQFFQKVPWEKFVKKRRIFGKIFCNMWNVLKLHCLVDDLDEEDMGHRNEKKNCFIFLKTVTDDFNRWLIVTHVVNKLCTVSSVHTKEWVYL